MTISAVLLIPTGLFLKSLVNLTHVDLGMNTENVIGFAVSPKLNAYSPEQTRTLYERMERELAAIPGVRSVADAQVPLIGGVNWGTSVKIEGAPHDADYTPASMKSARASWQDGIPLIAGREFTASDNLAGPKVAIVNQQFVNAFLGGRSPIGVHFPRAATSSIPKSWAWQGQPLRRREAGTAQALLLSLGAG